MFSHHAWCNLKGCAGSQKSMENWQPKHIQKHPKSSPLPPQGSIFEILGPSRKRQFIHEFWGPQKAIGNPKNAAAGCPGGPKRHMEDPPPISAWPPPPVLAYIRD
jgi:hypothetical protein